MNSRQIGRFLFFVGLLLSFTVILAWLITRDWQNLIPTWWQVIILIVSLILVSIKNLIPSFSKWKASRTIDPIPSILQNRTVDDLLRPLGRGGRVNYLFRNIVESNDLTKHRRLIITGETGSGKTRTAIELIRELILEEIISPQGIFVPDPAFQYLSRAELKVAIAKILSTNAVQLLFLDNLPGQINESSMELLSELLSACEPALVIITARVEELWEPFQKWLEKETFKEFHLQELTRSQLKRLLDLSVGVFGLQLSEIASSLLADSLHPSPGRLWVVLLCLANRKDAYITPDLVHPHTLNNLIDSLYTERTRLTDANPDLLFILIALAHFRSCHLQPDILFLIQFANELKKEAQRRPWFKHFFGRPSNILRSSPSISALDGMEHAGLLEAPQVVLDSLANPEIAHQELERYFQHRGFFIPDSLKRKFDPYVARQAWDLFLLGCAAHARKESELAIQLFSKSIRILPHAWFLTHRSLVYLEQNEADKAIQDANRAILLDPNCAQAYTVRANFLLSKNEFSMAIEDFSKAIELDPKDALAWINRGKAYFAEEKIDQAVNDFDIALKLSPDLPAAVMARAKAHNVRGHLDEAIAGYDQALALNPEDVTLLYSRATAYDSLQDYPHAIVEYSRLIELNPKDSRAYYNRGKAYHMLGNLEQAVLDYEQAILSNPHSAIAYRNRANALIRLNRLLEAKADCREAERLEPNHPYTHARWGQYFAAREDYIGAVEKYTLASKLLGDLTHFNLDIGLCLLCSGNSTEGLLKIRERLKKGAKQDEIQEALRDYEAQFAKHPMAGMQEAISLLHNASLTI